MFGFPVTKLAMLCLAALSIGMAKAGLTCINIPAVAIIAHLLGAKISTGIMLPIFMVGDMFGVALYVRHINWQEILKLILPTILGIILGTFFGNIINDSQFKLIMGILILFCVVFLVNKEIRVRNVNPTTIRHNRLLTTLAGIMSGFASMIGNVATPFFSTYLLAMEFKKNQFISTTALFFFLTNWIKFPFHVFWWKTITWETLKILPLAIPFVLMGAFLGYSIVKKINDRIYKIFITLMITIAALYLIF